jgi:hypothetical protein
MRFPIPANRHQRGEADLNVTDNRKHTGEVSIVDFFGVGLIVHFLPTLYVRGYFDVR